MLIASLKTHFTARVLEWIGSGVAMSWGYYLVTHPQLFTADGSRDMFAGLAQVAASFGQPPVSIGVFAMAVGAIRATALFINGSYERTPLIRLATSLVSVYLWTTVVVGFSWSTIANTGIILYPWLVIMDVVSGYRAGYDLVVAEHTARQARAVNGQRDSSTRSILRRVKRILFPATA